MANLDVKQAAARLLVSTMTVYRLCDAGKIRHYRVGIGRGRVVIPEEAFAEFLAGAEDRPPPPEFRSRHLPPRESRA
jgi:excisionase family DNA binding protein